MPHGRTIALLTLIVCASPARGRPVSALARATESGPGGPEHRYGLRVARRLSPVAVRLTFGASFVPRVGEQPATYRVVSETDPAFRAGVRAVAARHAAVPDDAPPAHWASRLYQRHVVELRLPRPMRPGHRYAVQALGVNGQPVTGGRAALWIVGMTDAAERRAATDSALGIRRIELVAPTVVAITCGDSLDTAGVDGHPEAIVLCSASDPRYRSGRHAARVGRRTRGDCFYTDGWPYGAFLKHEVFAVFDAPLRQGHTYALEPACELRLTGRRSRSTLTVGDRSTVNPAIKVNQVGYLPESPRKYAYVGAWMGSLGALDYAPWARRFEVRDASTHRVVLAGACSLRHRGGERTEGAYREDLSGEDVYDLDISALHREGRYYVAIPGMGRSFTFRIARDVYAQPFRVMMNGVLHQRCGIEMMAPFSRHYRPACHRGRTELTDLVRSSEGEAFQELTRHVVSTQKRDLYGGHHDAGDYNPRAHLDVAELCFMAYELNPQAFYDGQLSIPEAGNGVPDILDEGRWALDLWCRLQDADGGVRDGIESNGDPDQITLAEEDTKRDLAFAKDAVGSLRFAGCAAHASLLWRRLGRVDDARNLLQRAERAWQWAASNGAEKQPDALALAAVQLYRATGQAWYRQAFERASVFSVRPDADLDAWQQYDQRDASFYYARCTRPTDPVLKERILGAFRRRTAAWCRAAETEAYRRVRNPQAPNTWGTGAHPQGVVDLAQAVALLHDGRARTWIVQTCDWALGCNPMGTVFTTRLGQRCISSPLHMYSRYSPDGPIAGIQCEGPSPRTGGEKAAPSMSSWIGASMYPTGAWPQLQTYADLGMVPDMNEGIVASQMKSALAYAVLLPPHRASQPRATTYAHRSRSARRRSGGAPGEAAQ